MAKQQTQHLNISHLIFHLFVGAKNRKSVCLRRVSVYNIHPFTAIISMIKTRDMTCTCRKPTLTRSCSSMTTEKRFTCKINLWQEGEVFFVIFRQNQQHCEKQSPIQQRNKQNNKPEETGNCDRRLPVFLFFFAYLKGSVLLPSSGLCVFSVMWADISLRGYTDLVILEGHLNAVKFWSQSQSRDSRIWA